MRNFFAKLNLVLILTITGTSAACTESVESQQSSLNEIKIVKNVEWAKPNGKSLTMDIYIPQTGKTSYPVLVIYHGGGWLINTNASMDSMSTYVAQHSEIIVCNVNYRLLGDNSNTVKMNEIIEDALGALVWIKENIQSYKGDKNKIVITGDSAGGHLAAMVLLGSTKLESDGFEGQSYGFKPTYLPNGKTAEDLMKNNFLDVQGAVLSYPALDIYAAALGGFENSSNIFWTFAGKTPRGIFGDGINVNNNPNMYKAVSPVYLVPNSADRKLPPQLCMVGTKDNLILPVTVKAYVDQVNKAGHTAEYWEHERRPHAYLDSQKNDYLGIEFRRDAPIPLDKIISFINKLFY